MSKKARFCPNCGSTWVEPDTSNRAEIAFSGGNPNKWHCNDCDYTGIMPGGDPEQDFEPGQESEESKETIEFEPGERYPHEDTGFGTGYLKYVLYVTLPVLSIYILYKLLI